MSLDIEKLIQDDLKDSIQKKKREKVLRDYYENPNYCKCCGEMIIVKPGQAISKVKDRVFCSLECTILYKKEHPEVNFPKGFKNQTYTCLNCGKEVKPRYKYCSNQCQRDHQQKEWVEKWFAGEVSGNNDSDWIQVRDRVKKYLFDKYDNKCARCGWSEVNPYTGNIPLEVDHIDGDPYNTTPDNVILLCPNCHSLTSTYRGANRGKGRIRTWIPASRSIKENQ